MRNLMDLLPLLGEVATEISKISRSLKGKVARAAFALALESMLYAGLKVKRITSLQVVGDTDALTMERAREILASDKPVQIKVMRDKRKMIVFPGAWKERLATLKGLLPSFDSFEESTVKNRGAKPNGLYPELPSMLQSNYRTIETLSLDDDPVIGLTQDGLGPWKVRADYSQVSYPGEHTVTWTLKFLSGRTASAVVVCDGRKIKRATADAGFVPLFAELKPRMKQFVKYGPCYEKIEGTDNFRATYILDYPVLLLEKECEELKGLLAAEKASAYLDLSKTARGAARRGTKQSLEGESKMVTEEDRFRDRRAAKSLQKLTNRSAEEGIGEYPGGGVWEATQGPKYELGEQVCSKPSTIVKGGEYIDSDGPVKRTEDEKRAMNALGYTEWRTRFVDLDDDTRTAPTKKDKALGHEHPARHFRVALYGKPKRDGGWDVGSEPVKFNYLTRTYEPVYKKGVSFKFLEPGPLKALIYQELECGELMFWAESYHGDFCYPFLVDGIRVPSHHYLNVNAYLRPKDGSLPRGVPKSKERKDRLPCKDCGHTVWRNALHAVVCDYCNSEAFPRTWVYVLIPWHKVQPYVAWLEKDTMSVVNLEATHLKVRLFGRAVGYVVMNALRRGVDISKPQIERALMPGAPLPRDPNGPQDDHSQWGFKPRLGTRAVGIGRFLWEEGLVVRKDEQKLKRSKPVGKHAYKIDQAIMVVPKRRDPIGEALPIDMDLPAGYVRMKSGLIIKGS